MVVGGTVVNDVRKALVAWCGVIAVGAVASGLSFALRGVSGEVALLVIAVAYGGAFALDWASAWYGVFEKWGDVALFVHAMAQATVLAEIAYPGWGADTALSFIGIFGAAVLLAVAERRISPGRTGARTFRGLRTSGNIVDGLVCAEIPREVLDEYGAEFLESRIRTELEMLAEGPALSVHTPKQKTDLGFNVSRIDHLRVLHRVEGQVAEVLFVPEDGIVARFEEADDVARDLRFTLQRLYGFPAAVPPKTEAAHRDVEAAYLKFAAPTVEVRQFVRIRGGAILASVLTALLVALLAVVVANASAAIRILSEPSVATALASLAAIIFILGYLVAGARKLYTSTLRRKRK